MLTQGPIEDKLAIRELVESYNDAVMRFDAEAWGANWADDATWSLPGTTAVKGRDNIVEAWLQAMANFSFVGFFASAGPITVSGNEAQGTWYQQEFLHQKDGGKVAITGRYADSYVKIDGRWLFQSRDYTILNAE
jgi:uncharacterized protein (TIGR02246 family)